MEGKGLQDGVAPATDEEVPLRYETRAPEEPDAPPDLPPAGESELAAVRAVFTALAKTARIIQLYPSENSIYQNFTNDLRLKFAAYLDERHELVVDVEPDRILYKRRVMLTEEDRQDSLPGRLFRDGIRRLVFFEGIAKEELLEFLDVLSHPPDADDLEDDIVTLLWEKDFAHIQYFVLDAELDMHGGDSADLATNLKQGHEVANLLRLADLQDIDLGGDLRAKSQASANDPESMKRSRPHVLSSDVMGKVVKISEHDRETLIEMVKHDQQRDLRHDVTTLLFEVLSLRDHEDSFRTTISVLGLLMRSHVEAGEIGDAVDVLKKFRELEEAGLEGRKLDLVEEQIFLSIGQETLEAVSRMIEAPRVERPREILTFLKLLGPTGVNWLIDLIPRVKDHEVVQRFINELGEDNPQVLFDRMNERDPVILRRLIGSMGSTQNPEMAEWLVPHLTHENLPVRIEAITALARVGGPVAREGILNSLKDPEPEIRLLAMRALGQLRDATLLPALYSKVSDQSFIRLPRNEKQETLNAVAEIGGASALPYLVRIIQKKAYLQRKRYLEVRICAATALAKVPGPTTSRAIENLLKSAHGEIESVLKLSLMRIKAGAGENAGGVSP